jgi:hypothetical protein
LSRPEWVSFFTRPPRPWSRHARGLLHCRNSHWGRHRWCKSLRGNIRLPPLAGPSPPLATRSALAIPTCPRGRGGRVTMMPWCCSAHDPTAPQLLRHRVCIEPTARPSPWHSPGAKARSKQPSAPPTRPRWCEPPRGGHRLSPLADPSPPLLPDLLSPSLPAQEAEGDIRFGRWHISLAHSMFVSPVAPVASPIGQPWHQTGVKSERVQKLERVLRWDGSDWASNR